LRAYLTFLVWFMTLFTLRGLATPPFPLRGFFLFWAFFSLKTFIFSQNATVTGHLTDAETGEALVGVVVKIGASGAVSDLEGGYRISVAAGAYEARFDLTGYTARQQNIRLAAGESRTLDMVLASADNLLQQTTVTAGKFEKPLGQVAVSIEVIQPKLVESVNSTSVDEVLTKVPGLNILDGQASIRGGAGYSNGAGTRVLVLVDDIPALQPDAGLPNWDDFPVENLSQIEVLKGATSALYGSSAMNGIINLRTGYAKDKPETEFSTFGKTWDTPRDAIKKWWGTDSSGIAQPVETGFGFVHRRKAGKLDVVVGSYGLFRDSYQRETYSRYMRITPNLRYRVNERLSLGLNTNFNFGRSGSFFIWKNETSGGYEPGLGSATFTRGRLRFMIDPTLNYFDRSGNRHKILSRYFYVSNNNSGNQSNDSRMYYGEYQFQRSMEAIGLVVTAGVVGITTRIDAELYNDAIYTSGNAAAYLQADYQPIERLNLSGGVRYERNTLNTPEIIPLPDGDTVRGGPLREARPVFRIGANYQLARATYLRASWGQGYRYPTVAEKYINTDFSTGNSVTPNPNLTSETGWSAELALKQGFRLAGWQGYVDVAGFWQQYQNMMEFTVAKVGLFANPAPPPLFVAGARFQSRNQGNTRIVGGEVSIAGQGKIGPGTLSLLAGYTYMNPTYLDFTREAGFDPISGDVSRYWGTSDTSKNVLKYRFRHIAKWDSEYQIGRFSTGIAVQYNSRMEAIDAFFQLELPPPFTVEPFAAVKRFREKTGGVAVIDWRVAYRFSPKVKVSAIAANLTNREYTLRPALLEAPRNFTVRLDWKLHAR
jgi:outer membrane receptor protein involved in Fe transport